MTNVPEIIAFAAAPALRITAKDLNPARLARKLKPLLRRLDTTAVEALARIFDSIAQTLAPPFDQRPHDQ
jgi:hypothetical protein